MDKGWGISESILEAPSPEKYAQRQIQRAKEESIDPLLVYFNENYAVIKNLGGRCMVVTKVWDYALKRNRLSKMSLPEFERGYENKTIKVAEKKDGTPIFKPQGTWWRKHSHRRQYDTLIFVPNEEVDNKYYNMWEGFAVEPVPGECGLFLDHILNNICAGNQIHYEYMLCWLARSVQFPGRPGEVAVVLRGGRGVGKSFFAKIVGHLFGQHYMHVSDSAHLVGNFNSHLRDLVLLFADEAFYAGDKKHESILKTLITESTMTIEAKGIDVEVAPNYIHLIIASNDMHVIPAGGDERRFFVLDVAPSRQKDNEYFTKIWDQMQNGGFEALLYYFKNYDINDFEVREVPTTSALREQKILSLNSEEDWWFQKLFHGQLLEDEDGWSYEVIIRDLISDYGEYAQRHHIMKRSSASKLGRFVNHIVPKLSIHKLTKEITVQAGDGFTKKKTERVLCYELPSLEDCRAYWERKHGKIDWPEDKHPQENKANDTEIPF